MSATSLRDSRFSGSSADTRRASAGFTGQFTRPANTQCSNNCYKAVGCTVPGDKTKENV